MNSRSLNLIFLLILSFSISFADAAECIDEVIFGNSSSESAHSVVAEDTWSETGGLGETCRHIGSDGSITFTLSCAPDRRNYITVKLWGSQTLGSGQELYLYNDTGDRIGNYQAAWPEIARWGRPSQSPFPGRFVYSTYMIPRELTDGKTKVTLKLAGAPLQIYRAYTHLAPFFQPGDETQGTDPGNGNLRPQQTTSQYDYLVQQANLGIEEFLTWQLYGNQWDSMVAAGEAPEFATGAVTYDGRFSDDLSADREWKEDIYDRFANSNLVCLQALEAYGIAYNSQWSDYYQDPEMIDRILAGLTFFRIAQGANGAFGNPWGLDWVGGPDRVDGAHCLEGFGVHALPDAFLDVHEDITDSMLDDVMVDADDNPDTPDVSRRTAYTNLFKGIINHMLDDRGHAPNQDRAQVHAMYQANRCLQILSPGDAWEESTAKQWVYQATGAEMATIYPGTYWESEKGLALEVHGTINGGYCGNYGTAAISFLHTYGNMVGGNDAVVNERTNKAVDAFSNYVLVQDDSDGYKGLAREEVISWRPNNYPGRQFPNSGSFNGLAYAALNLDNQNAVRILQHYLNNRRVYTIDCSASAVAPHYEDNTLQAIKMVDVFQEVQNLAETDTRLPMEDEQDFAWADEQAAGVVVKQDDTRFFATLNYRHGYCNGCDRRKSNAVTSDIARIHYTTDTIDRIANVEMDSPYGIFELYTLKYGPFLMAMNCSEDTSYEYDPDDFISGTDLISGEVMTAPITLAPGTTVIFYDDYDIGSRSPDNPGNVTNGLEYKAYQGSWDVLPSFDSLSPIEQGVKSNFDISDAPDSNNFGYVFEGYIDVPADANYTFYTTSDDGSKLYIGITEVVDNDGIHAMEEASGVIGLREGLHSIRVEMFDNTGGEGLEVRWESPDMSKRRIPSSRLYYSPEVVISSEDFESGLGEWSNVTEGSTDWIHTTDDGTPTNGTGPDGGADNSSGFIFFETSYSYANYEGDTAYLESSEVPVYSGRKFCFDYHMYGSDIGSLNVDVYDMTAEQWDTGIWNVSGEQQSSSSDDYENGCVDLSSYDNPLKLRLRAVAAGGYRGDIAIDNPEVTGFADSKIVYGDISGNGIFDFSDLDYFCRKWLIEDCGQSYLLDINDDCKVDFTEFSRLNWK